jgi:hypothetical protein
VHFVHTNHDASFGMAVGKAHAVDDVISALHVDSEFFAKVSMTVAMGERDPLCMKLQAHIHSSEIQEKN